MQPIRCKAQWKLIRGLEQFMGYKLIPPNELFQSDPGSYHAFNNLYMGRTSTETLRSVDEINDRRQALGLRPIEINFCRG